jgi:hypothetical protein
MCPFLHGNNYGTDRCRLSFYRWAGSVGRETVSQQEECKRNHSELK